MLLLTIIIIFLFMKLIVDKAHENKIGSCLSLDFVRVANSTLRAFDHLSPLTYSCMLYTTIGILG